MQISQKIKQAVKTAMARVRVFFTKKKIIWTVVILVVLFLGWLIFGHKSVATNIQTGTAKIEDLEKTVLTTGVVVSSTDLSLSFQTSGVVRKIYVSEGDSVKAGQTLAVLDQGSALANLESAKGSLAQAEANYKKVSAAATSQDIAVSQASLDSAKTTLANAKQNLVNQLSTSYNDANNALLYSTNPLFSNFQSVNPQFGIYGTVQTNSQEVSQANNDRFVLNGTLASWKSEIDGVNDSNIDMVASDSIKNLSKISSFLNNIIDLLTNYTQLTSGGSQTTLNSDISSLTSAKSSVDSASTLITNYSQSIRSAISSVSQAQASLDLKQAPARPEDLGIAEAQVLSAQGSVDAATANLNNTVIYAPISGTITQVDVKLGEFATAAKEAITLLNVGELHTEAQVSEADIASVNIGQTIDNTFDALGPDKHFDGKVLTVNPASTVVSGVVNYKVTGSLPVIPEVKPGMTSNMTINVAEKKGVLAVPSSAIINKDGKKFVNVVDDPAKKTYHQVLVTTDLEADGGLTEITSGLSADQAIVTYIK